MTNRPLKVTQQFVRFLVSGATNTAASYALYLVLLHFMHYLIAYAIAYAFGIALSFCLMTRFVFRAPATTSTLLRFPLVYVAQFALGSALIYGLVEGMEVRASIAAAIAIVIVTPITFLVARYVFLR